MCVKIKKNIISTLDLCDTTTLYYIKLGPGRGRCGADWAVLHFWVIVRLDLLRRIPNVMAKGFLNRSKVHTSNEQNKDR